MFTQYYGLNKLKSLIDHFKRSYITFNHFRYAKSLSKNLQNLKNTMCLEHVNLEGDESSILQKLCISDLI